MVLKLEGGGREALKCTYICMKTLSRLIALITLSVIGVGCGPIYYLNEDPLHKEARRQGYELCHLKSCGPQALSDAFRCFKVYKRPFTIGKELQDDSRLHYRSALSLINHKFCQITCPIELLSFCKKHNFEITKKKNLNELNEDDVAIILIKGYDDLFDWHWMTYPTHTKSQIKNYFKED